MTYPTAARLPEGWGAGRTGSRSTHRQPRQALHKPPARRTGNGQPWSQQPHPTSQHRSTHCPATPVTRRRPDLPTLWGASTRRSRREGAEPVDPRRTKHQGKSRLRRRPVTAPITATDTAHTAALYRSNARALSVVRPPARAPIRRRDSHRTLRPPTTGHHCSTERDTHARPKVQEGRVDARRLRTRSLGPPHPTQ